jgi:hypothetical protein
MDIDTLFEKLRAEEEAIAAAPWYEKAAHWLCGRPRSIAHAYSQAKFCIRVRANRAIHGYDEYDWWQYYSNNSKRAVTLLTLLKNKGNGFVCMRPRIEHDCWDGICEEKWNAALEDMIFYHSVLAGRYEEVNERGISMTCQLGFKIKNPGKKAQFIRGKLAYFRYYEHLWG